MGIFYIMGGINHIARPDFYLAIMPHWMPFHFMLVLISGIFEIALGILVMLPSTSRIAAWGIIFLLIAVFPANIQMAVDYYHQNNPNLWVALLRLPLQIPLIWWAYIYTTKKNSVFGERVVNKNHPFSL